MKATVTAMVTLTVEVLGEPTFVEMDEAAQRALRSKIEDAVFTTLNVARSEGGIAVAAEGIDVRTVEFETL